MFESIRSKVLHLEDLPRIRKKHGNQNIVFCSGSYDILQSGHAVFFSQCKQFGDILVVGVGTDKVISELKGPSRPVNPENNRIYLVAALQDVDYAILNVPEMEAGKIDFHPIIRELQPDVFVLNEDDSGIKEKRVLCDKYHIRMEFVTRIVPEELQATSSTNIIDKIKFAYRAPLRIDFAGGWADVPFIMHGKTGYVSNISIKPYIELKDGGLNLSGYPRGSGLSTSTAVKVLELISSKNYNTDAKSLTDIAEDLFQLENKELNWAIGRQDQYSIVFGGFNCFECGNDYAKPLDIKIHRETLEAFKQNLVIMHTGVSRNAQLAVEQVYNNHHTEQGKKALDKISAYGKAFAEALKEKDFMKCASIMEKNFMAQKELASASSSEELDRIYAHAKKHGAYGGKISGAGGGGAFIFYCEEPSRVIKALKEEFHDCFEIDFDFAYKNIKELNKV